MMICENLEVLVCFGHLSSMSCTVRTLIWGELVC